DGNAIAATWPLLNAPCASIPGQGHMGMLGRGCRNRLGVVEVQEIPWGQWGNSSNFGREIKLDLLWDRGEVRDTMADVNVNAPADQVPTMVPPTRTDDQILPHIRWRALTTIINLCLTGKTLRFERPRAPVLQILWGVVNRAHIDYAERIWEEFTQSIHNFIEDKKNLAQHTHGKKKATLIVIPSIRFTKMIIYYLQRKHKFHPKLDSPLYLLNEELVLGYLKFSAKGTKREVFGMPIPGNLVTTDIKGEPYYKEYPEKVAKHQRYLAGEQGSDPDSPAPKPTKVTKKSKLSAPKAGLRPPVTKPASSQQPEPKPTSAKSQGKKCKLVMETSDKPSPAKKSKPGLEPRFDDQEAEVQRTLKESLMSVYNAARGSLPPMVIRKLESSKYQPLLEVQRKGKEKVIDEQVSLDLLNLQTPKKKSTADQFIFQRRTSTPTGSSGHDESSSLYAELGLTNSEVESDEDVPGIDARVQGKGQAGPNPSEQDKGQAGPNPSEQDKGQAGLNPGDVVASQPQSSPVVHAGPNLKHIDLEATDVSTQPHPKQMDEGFTTTSYPKAQENLKLTIKEHVILEEHASSTGTTTAETKAKSMVSVIIQQDTSAIPPMTTSIIDLTLRPDSLNVHRPLQAMETETTTTTTITTHPPPPQPQQSNTDSMLMKRIGKLKHIMTNLIQDNTHLEERSSGKVYDHDHTEELLKDLAEAHKKKKKSRDSPNTPPGSLPHQPPPPPPPACPSGASGSPRASESSQVPPPPPPPPSTNQEGQSHGSTTLSSSKTTASAELKAWTIINTRLRLSISSTPEDLQMDDDMAPDAQAHSSDDKDIENAHIPKNNWASSLASTYSPPPEDSLLAKPLPLGGPPGQVTIQYDFFFNKELEYLRYGSKGSRPALSILKMKAAYYLDVSLEKMVPDQMWIEEECKYDIAAMYVIDSPRAVTFRDKYGVHMIMRFNEIHNFSNDTLHQIEEALDYRVKDFRVNRMNSGLNTRFWTRKDVDRSKEFIFAIQKWLKIRRIFCNKERFVGR
nr:histone deacetylase 14 [Tanacetum cinerariifolium]